MFPDHRPRNDAPSAPASFGEVIGGKYRVEECIGYGGMGVVCAATHLELRRKLAIKFVRPELTQSEGFVDRFLNEARAAAALRSEHVAQVLDCGRLPSGTPYMVMEHLEGADLESIVGKKGPLPVALAVDYALQLCEALAEAHTANIIHRDIKPQNLFVTEGPGGTPILKVLDFGVSKRLGGDPSVTDTSHGVGSPYYMSPEQMTSPSEVDARTDIWSVGAVLFELLAGRPPFTGETLPEVCAKVVTQPAPFIRSFRPNVPPRLEAVVQRCLEKNRDNRFADIGELADAMIPFASSAGAASVDMVSRILGRESTRRPPVVAAELDSELATSSIRSEPESIPGVRKSRLPLLLLIVLFVGATVVGAQRLVRGGALSKSSQPETSEIPTVLISEKGDASMTARAPQPEAGLATVAIAASPAAAAKGSAGTLPERHAQRTKAPSPSAASAPHAIERPKVGEQPRAPRKPLDPRDVDPPGIGTVPVLTDPPEMPNP